LALLFEERKRDVAGRFFLFCFFFLCELLWTIVNRVHSSVGACERKRASRPPQALQDWPAAVHRFASAGCALATLGFCRRNSLAARQYAEAASRGAQEHD